MLATVLVPPPGYAGTFPVSTQEQEHGPLPPRRGVASMNQARSRVTCRIFFEGVASWPPGVISRMVYWREK